jgi:hypothetical protein
MADLTVTAAQVSLVDPDQSEIYSFVPNLAITPGQAVALNSSAKAVLADANDSGTDSGSAQQFKGLALEKAGVRQGLSVLLRGKVTGYDLSGLAYGAKVYLSDTAGALATAASATKTVVVGQVTAQSDSDLTKVLYINAYKGWTDGY